MIRTRQLQYAYPGGATLTFPDVDVPQGAVLLLSGPSVLCNGPCPQLRTRQPCRILRPIGLKS